VFAVIGWLRRVLGGGRFEQSTDDAYVSGNVVQITPQIGTVVSIGADDTQFVKAGQTLVKLDQADASVALSSQRSLRGPSARFAISLRPPRSCRPPSQCRDRRHEGRRRSDAAQRLAVSHAISNEELQHARDRSTPPVALVAAQQELAANRARIDRTTIEIIRRA
jgi:membrane fusion protein (multidrug efflux system)